MSAICAGLLLHRYRATMFNHRSVNRFGAVVTLFVLASAALFGAILPSSVYVLILSTLATACIVLSALLVWTSTWPAVTVPPPATKF